MFQTTNQIWSDGNSTSIQMVKMGMVDPRKTTFFHHHDHDAKYFSLWPWTTLQVNHFMAELWSLLLPCWASNINGLRFGVRFALVKFGFSRNDSPKSLGCPKKSFAKQNRLKLWTIPTIHPIHRCWNRSSCLDYRSLCITPWAIWNTSRELLSAAFLGQVLHEDLKLCIGDRETLEIWINNMRIWWFP